VNVIYVKMAHLIPYVIYASMENVFAMVLQLEVVCHVALTMT